MSALPAVVLPRMRDGARVAAAVRVVSGDRSARASVGAARAAAISSGGDGARRPGVRLVFLLRSRTSIPGIDGPSGVHMAGKVRRLVTPAASLSTSAQRFFPPSRQGREEGPSRTAVPLPLCAFAGDSVGARGARLAPIFLGRPTIARRRQRVGGLLRDLRHLCLGKAMRSQARRFPASAQLPRRHACA
jgi:hypothetical protein